MSSNTPQLLKGFRDFGPDKMSGRLAMLASIRSAFERCGFQPMETPALEYAETLTGKYGAEEKLMYRFTDQGGREVALRYDLTVPLARFYSSNRQELPRPFKRYAIGPVWRAENTQAGRFREFYQCDVDVVGSPSLLSDTDAIAAIAAALDDLGLSGRYIIKLNNRKIVDGILFALKFASGQSVSVLRELDKLEKIGRKAVEQKLAEAGLDSGQISRLFDCVSLSPENSQQLRDAFQYLLADNPFLEQGISELSVVLESLAEAGIGEARIDLTLARGLDYYTGTVCEVVLTDRSGFGSIAGGGRYDRLIGSLAGLSETIPAVGMSIGLDRLITALETADAPPEPPRRGCLVLNLGDAFRSVYWQTVRTLRDAGVTCDFYYLPDALDKQLRYAEKKGVAYALLIGDEEIKSGTVQLKDLATRKQSEVKAEKLTGTVLNLISK